MSENSIDILMITYNRAHYTRLALERLLETCDDSCRVWLWHNGTDEGTLEVVRGFLDHPRIHKFHHSEENKRLRDPTNWLWENAKGDYLSKVDDDCLVPEGWLATLRQAHEDASEFGILGCWRFMPEDFMPEVAKKKIHTYQCGHQVLRNCWIEGSGYLMKRSCVKSHGLLQPGESFGQYGIRLAAAGWVHGWYYPFLYQEHMDDPRAEHTLLKSDEDMAQHLPLSASRFGVSSLDEWRAFLRSDAREVQLASLNPYHYMGWRRRLRALLAKGKGLLGIGK